MNRRTVSVLASFVTALIGSRADARPVQIAGGACVSPPSLHCPGADCPNELVAHRGKAVLPKSNRAFFLDYFDLIPGEAVTFILNLHGGGMIDNWHRHYFPLLDVNFVYEQVGAKNIKAFWFAGHSHGGLTANRLLMTKFFRDNSRAG